MSDDLTILFSAPIQKQQQAVMQLDSSDFTQTSCLSNVGMAASQVPQMSPSNKAPTPTSLFSSQGSTIRRKNAYSIFEGFNASVGDQACTDATTTTAGLFGSTLFGTTVSGNVSNETSFGSVGFGFPAMSSSARFKPPAPSPASYTSPFGNNVSYNNDSINAPVESREYGRIATFFAAPHRLQPPPPPGSSALFGSSNSYTTNTSFMHPQSYMLQSMMDPYFSDFTPPPTTTAGVSCFSNTYSESQTLFSFDGSGKNTVSNFVPPMFGIQSMSDIPPASSVPTTTLSFGGFNVASSPFSSQPISNIPPASSVSIAPSSFGATNIAPSPFSSQSMSNIPPVSSVSTSLFSFGGSNVASSQFNRQSMSNIPSASSVSIAPSSFGATNVAPSPFSSQSMSNIPPVSSVSTSPFSLGGSNVASSQFNRQSMSNIPSASSVSTAPLSFGGFNVASSPFSSQPISNIPPASSVSIAPSSFGATNVAPSPFSSQSMSNIPPVSSVSTSPFSLGGSNVASSQFNRQSMSNIPSASSVSTAPLSFGGFNVASSPFSSQPISNIPPASSVSIAPSSFGATNVAPSPFSSQSMSNIPPVSSVSTSSFSLGGSNVASSQFNRQSMSNIPSASSVSTAPLSFGGSNVASSPFSSQLMSNVPPASSVLTAPFSFGHISETVKSSIPLSSKIMSTATSSILSNSLTSTDMLSDADKTQKKSDEPYSTVEQKKSSYHDKTIEQSSKPYPKSDLIKFRKCRISKQDQFPEIANQLKSTSEAKDVFHESSMSCIRYTDIRCDEQRRDSMVTSTAEQLYSDSSSAIDLMALKKKTRKSKSSPKTDEIAVLLADVTPLSLGIEDINGHMCVIIERNTIIPFRTQFYSVFTNAYAYQTTATIRVFSGEHKLTKYNTFLGEFTLTGLSQNFASQTLEISICMDADCNGFLQVEAEESRSGAKVKFAIDSQNYSSNKNDIERHLSYVESNPDFHAVCVHDRQPNDSLYMLKGETTNEKINFTGETEIFQGFSTFNKMKQLDLTSMMMNELKRIQLTNGSFDLNQDLANLLSINMKDFDELKTYLNKQGFSSFALNIQYDIFHLIATGIILLELLLQVPVSERNIFLVPFNTEQIQSILHRHLPKVLLENVDKAIHFYEQKRSCYGIYCEQLELNYSSWEKFIQYALFHMNN
ncbi:unnamed protein product [Rotaria sp. Silwood1]|nr:unnamed protein product [Rotaria sp. Silwood1]